MPAVGWIYHPFFERHRTGSTHPDQPERLEVIRQVLEDAGLLARLDPLPFRPATFGELCLVHEPSYVDLVRTTCEAGFGFIGDQETLICPESYDVAALAAGGVLAACDHVLSGRVKRAFCAVRPPGHHAQPDRAAGFCLFNNVALGAEHLIRNRGLARVAIVDFDVHHGNGTQRIFEARSDVLYVSLHEHPLSMPYPGTGCTSERGSGAGSGFTLNIHMAPGGRAADYVKALREQARPALDAFAPEFLLLSAGFDAQSTESIAHINLDPAAFGRITRELAEAADMLCQGRVVSVLEGGYDLGMLGHSVAAHVRALLEEDGRPATNSPKNKAIL